ncbi:hypothetical protein [Hymenobacter sp. PAMC 26628]|uniref:hypothetical protein n=1 Tax=Hymenobacter sp. PAMC 26628 TaxID=1484118 RepID=UPI00077031ED|nr:hypothetical protein [Hymenobacter sp. PAMC 26628]AMJ67435.1 hypothetical protein AXW84_19905 [Hymenobacter sp. PAMC 26628]
MNVLLVPRCPCRVGAILLGVGLLLGLGGCSAPVQQYPAAQLFPPNYAAALATDTLLSLSKSTLCQGFTTLWDSFLVAKPYVSRSVVIDLPIGNYGAVSEQVYGQSLDDFNCTLLFVKSGRYVAYSVVHRSVDLADIKNRRGNSSPVWLTKTDAQRLFMKKNTKVSATDTATWYSVVLASQK